MWQVSFFFGFVLLFWMIGMVFIRSHHNHVDSLALAHGDNIFIIPDSIYPIEYIDKLLVLTIPSFSIRKIIWKDKDYIMVCPTLILDNLNSFTLNTLVGKLMNGVFGVHNHTKHRLRWINRNGVSEIAYTEIYTFNKLYSYLSNEHWKLAIFTNGIAIHDKVYKAVLVKDGTADNKTALHVVETIRELRRTKA